MNELEINSAIQRILTGVTWSGGVWAVQDSYEALRSAGEQIVPNVISAMRRCADGEMWGSPWWNGAPLLCDLLREMNTQSTKNALLLILNTDSRIFEFGGIRSAAAQNLGATGDPTLIPELLAASRRTGEQNKPLTAIKRAIKELGGEMPMTPELIIQEGIEMWSQEALEHFRRYEQEVANWPRGLQCAFYWFYGIKVEHTMGVQAALPYYAASALANPSPAAGAWTKFKGEQPSLETAERLSKRYPLPSGNLPSGNSTAQKKSWLKSWFRREKGQKEEKNKPLTREDVIRLRQKAAAPIGEKQPAQATATLRLCNPSHLARRQLDEETRIIDKYVQVIAAGDDSVIIWDFPPDERGKALVNLEESIALCPEDMDLLVAKASVLQAAAQFKSAEEVLDVVLSKASDHFEARMWKSHLESWDSPLRFPPWSEQQTDLHPVMAGRLRQGQRVQLVRDGLQKTLAIVAGIQELPLAYPKQIKVEWIPSRTPYGPLMAYYLDITSASGKTDASEAFIPLGQPTEFKPMEGFFLIQQLVFTPYCYVVVANRNNKVIYNRRTILEETVRQKISNFASELSSTQAYLTLPQYQNAVQWHIAHFDMERYAFK